VITTFLRPASNAFDFPEDIATGSDGNLWYTSHNTDEIVRFNPNTPVFTGFTDPLVNMDGPTNITAVPNGDLWSDRESGKIWRER